MIKRIILASSSNHKLKEIQDIAFEENLPLEILSGKEFIKNIDQLGSVEKFDTFIKNAKAKADAAILGDLPLPVLSDDSGLCVDCLGREPGVRSARYSKPKKGIPQSQANIEKLIHEIRKHPKEQRSASFVTVMTIKMPDQTWIQAEGILKGQIIETPRGKAGFGYDPVFIPDGHRRTLAEMSAQEKNALSHRGQAAREIFKKFLSKHH